MAFLFVVALIRRFADRPVTVGTPDGMHIISLQPILVLIYSYNNYNDKRHVPYDGRC